MITREQVDDLLRGSGNVLDNDGDKIGRIGQIFLDDRTGQPEWVTVKTGLFGTGESFVPLEQGSVSGSDLRVPYDKARVKGAPRIDDSDGHLGEDQEAELYRYYGLSYDTDTSDSGLAGTGTAGYGTTDTTSGLGTSDATYDTATAGYATDTAGLGTGGGRHAADTDTVGTTGGYDTASTGRGVVGNDVSGPETDSAMTRSEERVSIGTERVTTGKARLRKYVVSETVSETVPVTHEEVRIEREPITEANRGAAYSGGDLTSEEHEVTLHAERVEVDKEVVPVERIRADVDTVTEQQTVNTDVRKEVIEIDTDGDGQAEQVVGDDGLGTTGRTGRTGRIGDGVDDPGLGR